MTLKFIFIKIKNWLRTKHPSFFSFIKRALRRPKDYKWISTKTGGIKKKEYSTYHEYVKHQGSKIKKIKDTWLKKYDAEYREILREKLRQEGIVKSEMNVLCLAARLGGEVRAFIDLGCFAVGLDLNPGENNKYVLHGDFHNIQFVDNSVDAVFTNSLDHSFDLTKTIKEIKRVLKPNGLFILESVVGEKEGYASRYYESMAWETVNDLLALFTESGFKVIKKLDVKYPGNMQNRLHVYFKRV